MTLQRDVTFNLAAGEVRQPEVNNTPQAVASLVNLGIGLFQQQKKQEAQAMAEGRKQAVMQGANRLINEYLEKVKQNPDRADKFAIDLRKQMSNVVPDATPEEMLVGLDLFKKSTGKAAGQIVQESAQDEVSFVQGQVKDILGNEQDRNLLFGAAPQLVNKVATGQATLEEQREAITLFNELESKQIRAEAARERADSLINKEFGKGFSALNEETNLILDVVGTQVNGLAFQASNVARLPDAQKVEQFAILKQQTANTLGSIRVQIDQRWESMIAKAVDSKHRDELRKGKEAHLKRVDQLNEFMNTESFEEFDANAKALKWMTDEIGLNIAQAAPALQAYKQVAGPGWSAVIGEVLAGNAEIGRVLKDAASKSIAQGLSGAEQAVRKLDTIVRLHTDTTINDLSVEERDEMAASMYKVTKEAFDTGNIVHYDPTTKQRLGENMVMILDRAINAGDVTQRERALKLLNRKDFTDFMGGLDSGTQEVLKGMVVQFNLDVLNDPNNGILSRMSDKKAVNYDASKGKFVVNPVRPSAVSGFGGTVPESVKTEGDKKDVEAANQYLEKVVANKNDDPFLASLSDKEVKEWVLFSAAKKPAIKGKIRDFDDVVFEAAERRMSVEEVKKLKQEEEEQARQLELLKQRADQLQAQVATGKLVELSPERQEQEELFKALISAGSEEVALEILRLMRQQGK